MEMEAQRKPIPVGWGRLHSVITEMIAILRVSNVSSPFISLEL